MISSSVDEDTSYSSNLDGIKKYPSPLRGLSPDGRTSKWEPPGEEFDSRFAKKNILVRSHFQNIIWDPA